MTDLGTDLYTRADAATERVRLTTNRLSGCRTPGAAHTRAERGKTYARAAKEAVAQLEHKLNDLLSLVRYCAHLHDKAAELAGSPVRLVCKACGGRKVDEVGNPCSGCGGDGFGLAEIEQVTP